MYTMNVSEALEAINEGYEVRGRRGSFNRISADFVKAGDKIEEIYYDGDGYDNYWMSVTEFLNKFASVMFELRKK